ncbi:MAG: T9SS type A sorting domain-containing protein [Bacteroidia bacterium]|nr:T9SS type A sorting domain-containing protein [Bacteroidia bacterium]
MTNRLNLCLIIALFSLAFLKPTESKALTYTTLAPGSWTSVFGVWSTNGITPCFCAPPTTTSGFNIVINHDISMTSPVTVSAGDTLTIGPAGGASNLAFQVNGRMINNGTLTCPSFVIGGLGQMENWGTMTVNGTFTNLGDFHAHNDAIINGNFDNRWDIWVYNGVNVTITGNYSNYGSIRNLDASSCVTVTGSFTNYPFAIVGGTGGISVSGNLTNAPGGIWNPKVSWCAGGTDSGMPTPENCASPCALLFLPVKLISFDGTPLGGGRVRLNWVSGTENNNDFFTIERSSDQETYVEIGKVNSNYGTSNSPQNYVLVDEYALTGMAFYRVKQTDLDGRVNILKNISVYNDNEISSHASIFPNPFEGQLNITFNGIQDESLKVGIYDLSGKKIVNQEFQQSAGFNEIELDLKNLAPGTYFAELWFGRDIRQFTKIIHR